MTDASLSVQSAVRATLIWRVVFFLYLLIFIYGFLFLHAVEDRNRIVREVWDFGHVVAFFTLTFLLYKISRAFNTLAWRTQSILMIVAALVIGLIVETIQLYTGRSFSLDDIYLNVIGTVTGVIFFSNWSSRFRRGLVWLLRGLVVVLLVLVTKDLFVYSLDAYHARQQFPSLISLEYPFELSRLGGAKVRLATTQYENEAVVEAQFLPARYSTMQLDHFPRDWSGYQSFGLTIFNPEQQDITIHMRIHDLDHFQHEAAYSDRFNTTYQLQPGWNQIHIPLAEVEAAPATRAMDMHRIHKFMMFFIDLQETRRLLIGRIGLE